MRVGRTRAVMAGLSLLVLAACHRAGPEQNGSMIVPEQSATPTPAPPPQRNPTANRIEPLNEAAPPTPVATPTGPMRVHKDFTDPPLPAELNDDGGLKPLPPRPHPGG